MYMIQYITIVAKCTILDR